MASSYLQTKDAVRVKVIQHSNTETESQCCKFSVAPELTGYGVLQNLISRAFDLHGDFKTCYLARDDRLPEACWLPLSSDFDLELAFVKSSDPYLLIKVDLHSSFGSWDVASIDIPKLSLPEIPRNNYSNRLPEMFKEKMEKTLSLVQKAFSWNDYSALVHPIRPPMSDLEFQRLLDPQGVLKDPKELRLKIYLGGVEPSLRKVVWKHLLNVYPENLTGRERMNCVKDRMQEYYELRSAWQKYFATNKQVPEEMSYTTNMVRKDVLRTDRHHSYYSGPDDNTNVTSLYNILTTYALNHPSVGYCQGMSDLASPLLVTMRDEAQAYICFCALMLRLKDNFHIDGDAMTLKFQHLTEGLIYYDYDFFCYLRHQQADDLLFCYRWLLLELKREFAFDDAHYMLEVLWSTLPPKPPTYKLPLVEVAFNPVMVLPSPAHSVSRQSHYANVCKLRRLRSRVSSKRTLLAILNKKATSIDYGDVATDRKLNRTLSQPADDRTMSPFDVDFDLDSSPMEVSKNALSSPPDSAKKIRNLKEFRNLTAKMSKGTDIVEGAEDESPSKDTKGREEAFARRCFSESDAEVGMVTSCVMEDAEVWQNPVVEVMPEEDQILHVSIVATEDRPPVVKMTLPSKPTDPPPLQQCQTNNNRDDVFASESQNGLASAWQVSVGGSGSRGSDSVPCLPPPDEFGGGNPFLMFLCLTLLLQHRNEIMHNKMDHNELAIHFDKLVRRHDVRKVLVQTRKMFESYCNSEYASPKEKKYSSATESNHSTC